MGYTLQQLQSMGAKPVTPTPSPVKVPAGGFTVQQLQAMGAKPVAAGNPTGAAHQAMREQMANDRGIPLIENDTRANGVKQGVLPNLPSATVDAVKQTGQKYKNAFNKSVDVTADAI